jgi:uncharacterized protein
MRFYLPFIILPVIIISIDLYVYYGKRHVLKFLRKEWLKIIAKIGFWLVPLIALSGLAYIFFNRPIHSDTFYYQRISLFLAFVTLFYLPKIVFMVFVLADHLYRLFRWLLSIRRTTVRNSGSRRKFILNTGLLVSAIPFLSLLHGVTRGKYLFQVHDIPIRFRQLPLAFNGFRIIQISDLHINAFVKNEDHLLRAVELINSENPDLVLFTGDMVNNNSNELVPFVSILKKIKSSYGKFSILGNHDYGDYTNWPSDQEKQADHNQLIRLQEEAGFRVLRNENVNIERDGAKIELIGVENYGKPPFPKYGNLKDAMSGTDSSGFKLLMSHDPSHWDLEVRGQPDIALTLSGHTHGMQMGIEIPGFKWSPVQYKYPRWAGLYEEQNQFLYVNRGLGYIGYAGRAGIYPEITSFELKSV